MKGAESFHDIEKFSGSRFENCQLGKQTEGKMVRLEAEAYDVSLVLSGDVDAEKLASLIGRFEKTAEHFERKGNREWAYAKNGEGGEHYAKARDAYERAERNRQKADTLKEMLSAEFQDNSMEGDDEKFFYELKEDSENDEYKWEKLTEKEKKQFMPEILDPEAEYDFPEFDFDDKGLKRALEYFARPDWNELCVEDKKRIVSSYVGELTIGLDISKMPKTEIRQMPEICCGAYSEKGNKIYINSKLLDEPEMLAYTIAHEMRHAYQYERAKKGETHLDKLYGLNFENYIRPVRDESGNWIGVNEYKNQLVEAEANAFAERITGTMEEMK